MRRGPVGPSQQRGVRQHLLNLDIGLPLEQMRQPIRRCLIGESTFERLTVAATNRRGRPIAVDVTCTPFALGANKTWGAIVIMQEKTSDPSDGPS